MNSIRSDSVWAAMRLIDVLEFDLHFEALRVVHFGDQQKQKEQDQQTARPTQR